MVPAPPAEEGSVMVAVRVRPQTPREQEGNRNSTVQVIGKSLLVFDPEEPSLPGMLAGFDGADSAPRRKGKDLKFVFDRVFGESATQAEVFESTTKEILDGVLNGYNCSVFAYGATGAGKTHTMLGSEKDPGIMYLSVEELYKKIEARKEEKHCEVLVCYQEVYNEQIHDLLEPKGPLAIREDPEKGVMVQGLSFHKPKSAEQLLKMLAQGNKNRTQHPTDINATSSRSHAVFQVYLKQHDRVMSTTQDLQVAKMSLIDLAGSERASIANTNGDRLREGANINRSLLALINVISALADAKSKKPHIPYRDSKLTRLLKDSIGGNCRTVMIAAVSPSMLSYEDTYNTLKYANRAKEIKLLMKSNVLSLDCHISQYAAICEQLKAEVADLRGRLRAYEENIPGADCHVPALPAHFGPASAEPLRPKEAGLSHEVPNKVNQEIEMPAQKLEPSCAASSSGRNSVDQELGKKPGCSSTVSSNPMKQETVNTRLQGMDKHQLEILATAILRVAQRQYARLKAANLLTPDTVAEFEELDCLMQGDTSKSQRAPPPEEQVGELDAANPVILDQKAQLPVNEAMLPAPLPAAEPAGLIGSSETLLLPPEVMLVPSPVFKTPQRPTKKRKKSAGSTMPTTLAAPKGQAKRPRKACHPPRQGSFPQEWAALAEPGCSSTPIAERARCPNPPLPLTVTKKGRAPLATAAAQNCSTPAPSRDLNATFDLSEHPCSGRKVSSPEFSGWENIQHFSNPQGAPCIPRASMPVFTMKGSSIPRSSSLACKASMQKRRRATSSATHSLDAPRSRIARLQRNSVKSSQVATAPGRSSCNVTWKWR